MHRVCALSIKNNLLSSKASRAIGDSLLQHEHSQLRYFVCSHWQITETSTMLRAVAEGLVDDDVILISGVLRHNTVVRKLNLAHNDMIGGQRGLAALTQMLSINTTLTSLNLSGCGIFFGSSFVRVVFEKHPSLQNVDISKNKVAETDANEIGTALRYNKVLQRLVVVRGKPIMVQEVKQGQISQLGKITGLNATIVLQLRRRIFASTSCFPAKASEI